jgi:hypothetical protein
MTLRSIIIGLGTALFIAGYNHFSDYVVHQGRFISNLMPVAVYGTLLFFLLIVNPLLRRLKAEWALRARELAVVVGFALVACSVPSYGIVECIPTGVMLPQHLQRVEPGWKKVDAVGMAPKRMLADVSEDPETLLNEYVSGMSEGKGHISYKQIPWHVWWRPLGFWLPLVLCMAIGTLGLALVFHRQWSRHEQLPYPITRFARALFPKEGRALGGVFHTRAFWIGFGLIFLILLNNYLCRWWPQIFIRVQQHLDFTPMAKLVPTLVQGHGLRLLRPTLLFTVIGLSYFLASEVSFSMAFGPFIFCFIAGILAKYGIALRTGHHQSVKLEAFLFTGGYTGIVLMVLYTGRYYYWSVLKRCFGLRAKDDVPPAAAWGMRVFLVATGAFVAQLVLVGLDWQLAILYTILALIIYITVSRTIAETGAFYIGTEVFPGAIIWGFMGAAALGPSTMVIMFFVTVILLVGPGWAPMPFAVQALKVSDDEHVGTGRFTVASVGIILICTVVALFALIYWQYDQGALQASGGWPRYSCQFPWKNMVEITDTLTAQGTLQQAESLSGWQRFTHLQPTWPAVSAFFIALALSLGIGMARLRFVRWPFHPVMFVFLGGAQALTMSGSFMIGWIIKTLVNKYGGERMYQSLKPFMIGVIAGDMAGQFVPMLVGTVHYLITGQRI